MGGGAVPFSPKIGPMPDEGRTVTGDTLFTGRRKALRSRRRSVEEVEDHVG